MCLYVNLSNLNIIDLIYVENITERKQIVYIYIIIIILQYQFNILIFCIFNQFITAHLKLLKFKMATKQYTIKMDKCYK